MFGFLVGCPNNSFKISFTVFEFKFQLNVIWSFYYANATNIPMSRIMSLLNTFFLQIPFVCVICVIFNIIFLNVIFIRIFKRPIVSFPKVRPFEIRGQIKKSLILNSHEKIKIHRNPNYFHSSRA